MSIAQTDTPPTIELSAVELWLLLGLSGSMVAYGIKDPHVDQMDAGRQQAQQSALYSLVERDLVRQIDENEVALEQTLADIIETCAYPQHTVLVETQWPDSPQARRYLYFGQRLVVECLETEAGQYRLTAIPRVPQLGKMLKQAFGVKEARQSKQPIFDLPESVFENVRQLCANGRLEEGMEALLTVGLSGMDAGRLRQALTSGFASASVAVITHQADNSPYPMQGFGIWWTETEPWLLQQYERQAEKRITLSPVSVNTVQARFCELLP